MHRKELELAIFVQILQSMGNKLEDAGSYVYFNNSHFLLKCCGQV